MTLSFRVIYGPCSDTTSCSSSVRDIKEKSLLHPPAETSTCYLAVCVCLCFRCVGQLAASLCVCVCVCVCDRGDKWERGMRTHCEEWTGWVRAITGVSGGGWRCVRVSQSAESLTVNVEQEVWEQRGGSVGSVLYITPDSATELRSVYLFHLIRHNEIKTELSHWCAKSEYTTTYE